MRTRPTPSALQLSLLSLLLMPMCVAIGWLIRDQTSVPTDSSEIGHLIEFEIERNNTIVLFGELEILSDDANDVIRPGEMWDSIGLVQFQDYALQREDHDVIKDSLTLSGHFVVGLRCNGKQIGTRHLDTLTLHKEENGSWSLARLPAN